ncbi:hypothetical protein [Bacillus cereus group sp. BfR-BA-01310]|uniref:hypothetical protein n=1 Tax=Bacillus cereus group sp. BfR-BA-01310 TaxID=2920287 RepID=UPI000BFE7532|nr:hypothetical protein [Bacillus cereus group sp. BfR-BA-01310]PGM56906.1 hypothetical protein CN947_23720 [Bacillus cereus]
MAENIKTGIQSAKGEELKLGDVLSGDELLDTVVGKEAEGQLHAQVVSEPFITFDLEDFLRQNRHVVVSEHTNEHKRSKKKIFEE